MNFCFFFVLQNMLIKCVVSYLWMPLIFLFYLPTDIDICTKHRLMMLDPNVAEYLFIFFDKVFREKT